MVLYREQHLCIQSGMCWMGPSLRCCQGSCSGHTWIICKSRELDFIPEQCHQLWAKLEVRLMPLKCTWAVEQKEEAVTPPPLPLPSPSPPGSNFSSNTFTLAIFSFLFLFTAQPEVRWSQKKGLKRFLWFENDPLDVFNPSINSAFGTWFYSS